MTTPQESASTPAPEQKVDDKERNFRAMERKYEKQLAEERALRLEAERIAQEAAAKRTQADDDDESEPYVDHKKLAKKLSSFEKKMEATIEKKAEEKARSMIDRTKQESWMRANPDFYDIMKHADQFAQNDPELAETILEMPDTFERQKLVYKSIKAAGLHKPAPKQSTIQEKVDANRRTPYYQPSNIANAPHAAMGDFSEEGQKQAYQKMMDLKKKLRVS